MLIEISDRELAHVLVGLRMVQDAVDVVHSGQLVYEQFDDVEVMNVDELDELCEELNCPGEEIYLAWDPDQFRVLAVATRHEDAVDAVSCLDDVVVRPFLTGK